MRDKIIAMQMDRNEQHYKCFVFIDHSFEFLVSDNGRQDHAANGRRGTETRAGRADQYRTEEPDGRDVAADFCGQLGDRRRQRRHDNAQGR